MTNKNPLIDGVQVIPRDVVIPRARFLSEDEVSAYQERVRSEYKNNPRALKSLLADIKWAEGVLRFNEGLREPEHSNFWVVVELQEMGIPVASAETLDILAGTNPNALRKHYEDLLSLVLRSAQDSTLMNNPLIQDLLPQVKRRLKKREMKYPVLLTGGFHLVDAANCYGLSLKLTDQTQVAVVPEFDYKNDGKTFSVLDAKGAPVFTEDGTRTFYAGSSGLSRLGFCRKLELDSDYSSLASSYSDGRIVVVQDAK